MDEFGVLTERYGLKPQGKSAPMSQAKRSTAANITTANRNFDFGFTRKPMSFSSKTSWNSSASNGSFLDDHAFFPKQNSQNSFGCGEDNGYKFGGFENPTTNQSNTSNNSSSNGSSYHLASMLFNSDPRPSSTNSYVIDDVFGEMPVSQNANSNDDIGSCPVGDLLGDYSGVAAKLKGSSGNGSWDSGKNEAGVDDLIPGFGGSSTPVNRTNVETTKSTFRSTEEPFVVLESDSGREYNFSEAPTDTKGEFSMFNQSGGTKPHGSSNASQSLRPPPKPANILEADKGSSASLSRNKVKSSGASLIDELEDFAKGRVNNEATISKEAEDASEKTQQNRGDDLESFFSESSKSNSGPKSMATTLDPTFDKKILNRQQNTFAGASSTESKASPVTMTNGSNDLSFIFGAASMFGEFEEVEGESEGRRRSRLGRYQWSQDRIARAVADMNQRDRQTQHEQEERRRIAEAINFEIKRWSAGKEGNMRALLSSLQQVLWSECGWEPVSLTDLITSGSVKKVYRKATLCVHPDKVQQKGATLEQKYIAEKVFDILKEAWNKFNREELS